MCLAAATAALAAALATRGAAGAGAGLRLGSIIDFSVADAHVHLISTTNGIDYLWAKPPGNLTPPERCPCRPPCYCNWTLSDYVATSSASWAVDTVIFCEVDAAHSQWLAEASWVQSLADRAGGGAASAAGSPRIGAIIAQPPPGFLQVPVTQLTRELDALERLSLVVGVRPSWSNVSSEAVVAASLDELGRRGLVVDLNMPLQQALATVQRSPRARFVVEHFGGANVSSSDPAVVAEWRSLVRGLAKHGGFECLQLGGVMGHFAAAGIVDQGAVDRWVGAAVEEAGYDRLCFEGNWFFNNWPAPHEDLAEYGRWATALLHALRGGGATDAQLRAVLRDNTLRVYARRSSDE